MIRQKAFPLDDQKYPKQNHAVSAKGAPSQSEAESVAIAALQYIGADHDRLARFLGLTGLEPDGLRRAASQPGFLLAILDHLAGHEPDLLAFAQAANLAPERVEIARRILGGTTLDD